MNDELLQNNLAEATTEMGFVHVLNKNAGETIVALQKEVTLDSGETVVVEGITPDKMKSALNTLVDGTEEVITFKTPGEKYVNGEVEIGGICQAYNASVVAPDVVSIAVTTAPTKTEYVAGESFDATGMVITATYSNETSKAVTGYTIEPSGALATTDTSVTITYAGKTTTQAITVTEPVAQDLVITAADGKTASMNTHNLATYLLENLPQEQLEKEILDSTSDDLAFIDIGGTDNFSSIYFNFNEAILKISLAYKTSQDTSSIIDVFDFSDGSSPEETTLSSILQYIQESYYEPQPLAISNMGAGVSTYLRESTPVTIRFADNTTYESTIDLEDYITVGE